MERRDSRTWLPRPGGAQMQVEEIELDVVSSNPYMSGYATMIFSILFGGDLHWIHYDEEDH